jgi:hypothetical protein
MTLAPPTQHGHHHWSPQIKPSQPPLYLNELLHEKDDMLETLMPESLDALLVEVGEDYGQEAD